MTRYDLYTALMGICAVFLSLTVYIGELPIFAKIPLIIFGVIVFVNCAYTLYRSFTSEKFLEMESALNHPNANPITQISLLNKNGESILEWELYGRTSVIIGKDIGENYVDIDLGKTAYASMIDVEHAVLNYAEGNWYIEDLDSQNGISIKKLGQDQVYKLSSLQACKLDFGDIIIIGMCQLKVS